MSKLHNLFNMIWALIRGLFVLMVTYFNVVVFVCIGMALTVAILLEKRRDEHYDTDAEVRYKNLQRNYKF